MDVWQILNHCLDSLAGTVLVESLGEMGVYYNPGLVRDRGVYILTVKEQDSEQDKFSQLDREGVFRLNIGVPKQTQQKLFGSAALPQETGNKAEVQYDYTALDTILPHPVYAWMGWICVLNPSEETFETLQPLIKEAYAFAVEKFNRGL